MVGNRRTKCRPIRYHKPKYSPVHQTGAGPAVLVTARFCEPSSELHIAEGWYRRTALCDLLQLGEAQVNKDRLYRSLDHLLAHKAALEAHLGTALR